MTQSASRPHPHTSQPIQRHLVIGGGRVARHLHFYFESLGIDVQVLPHARDAAQIRKSILEGDPNRIWICVSDRAIDSVATEIANLAAHRVLLHVSGAHRSPHVHAMHPLMTFGPELYPASTYASIAFIGDENTPALAELEPRLTNPCFRVPADERTRYHALCSMAGGFSTLLWQKLFSEFESRWKIPASAAAPFLRRMTEQLIAAPGSALTGPLARGDFGTIESHLAALQGDPYHAVYLAFVEAYGEAYRQNVAALDSHLTKNTASLKELAP